MILGVRQFRLRNARGEFFDLMRRDALFHAPSGLGFAKSNSYSRLGNRYELRDSFTSQKMVKGEMVFSGYEQYEEFRKFISFDPLVLYYAPKGKEYKLDCTVSQLAKSEISHENNKLICNIDFTGLSKWYFEQLTQKTAAGISGAKIYPYSYAYRYSETQGGTIKGYNSSSEPSSCFLHIFGEIKNPSWILTATGDVLSSGSLSGTIKKGNKLFISSLDGNLRVAECDAETGEVLRECYQQTDFTKETFLKIPPGDFTVTVTGESFSEIVAYLEVIEEYDTV